MCSKLPRRNPVFGVDSFNCPSVRLSDHMCQSPWLQLPWPAFSETPLTPTIKSVRLPFLEFKSI